MSSRKKILFICGSLNQTMMMHKVSRHLDDYDCRFTHFYTTGPYRILERLGVLDFTILGEKQRRLADEYLKSHRLPLDPGGGGYDYALTVTGTDLVVQSNLRGRPLLLIQEGMTDPETLWFHVAKWGAPLGVPRWIAKTSTTGLSDAYDRFCVASEGYRELFIRKGVRPEKIRVTGIPNYDDCAAYLRNDYPHRGYVLVATSDIRENFGWDDRARFLQRVRETAGTKPIFVKLHPNEHPRRRGEEVKRILPDAEIVSGVDSHVLVANCDVLVTQYSTLAYTGLALGKTVHSYFDPEELKRLLPIQNGGRSAANIAGECRALLGELGRFPAETLRRESAWS